MTEKTRIAIAVATHDTVTATFATDAMSLCLVVGATLPPNYQAAVKGILGTYIHIARTELMLQCIAEGADYMLWLDSDMRFPADGLNRLLAHGKPMVGINYSTRRLPSRFTALEHTSGPMGGSKRLETRPESTGLARVDALGFGFLLMDLRVVRPVLPDPEVEPWFWYHWQDSDQNMGEDVYFCRLLERAGVPIYVDQDLSKMCAHSGQIDYMTNHPLLFKDGKPVPPTLLSAAS